LLLKYALSNPIQNPAQHLGLVVEEWISVLRFSTRWSFKSIRALAIDCLSEETCRNQLKGPEWISLARELKVSKWFIIGCQELLRDIAREPLSLEKATEIGLALCYELNGMALRRYKAYGKSLDPDAIVSQKYILGSELLKSEYTALEEESKAHEA
jgi:hypothetical protein